MGSSGLSRRRALTGIAGVGIGLPVLAACGDDEDPTSAATAALASTSDIPVGGGVVFADAGVVVTQPEAGQFTGFDVKCTHRQCPVNEVTDTIRCPCHGSRFSIVDGAPQEGSLATDPLGKVALTVEGDQISLG